MAPLAGAHSLVTKINLQVQFLVTVHTYLQCSIFVGAHTVCNQSMLLSLPPMFLSLPSSLKAMKEKHP